jgi:hypothetical protein
LGDLHVPGRRLRWIFRKWEGVMGTGWKWLRIGTGGGPLCGNELSGSIKFGEFLDKQQNQLASQGLCSMKEVSNSNKPKQHIFPVVQNDAIFTHIIIQNLGRYLWL